MIVGHFGAYKVHMQNIQIRSNKASCRLSEKAAVSAAEVHCHIQKKISAYYQFTAHLLFMGIILCFAVFVPK